MSTNYSPTVAQLLTFGDCRDFREWPNYLELGIGPEHIPELISMATDERLHWAAWDSLEVWAPNHAWRVLGQLRATQAIEPLLRLFHELEDSDWAGEELPEVYGMIGPIAIPALTQYLADPAHDLWPRVTAAHSLERIATLNPSARSECIAALSQQLEQFTDNDPTLNAFLISFLTDIKAVEAAPVMERAFAADRVELSIQGDWEDVQVELGLKAMRETPTRNYSPLFSIELPRNPAPSKNKSVNKAAAKAKSKRKQSKTSRKANKKRK